MNKSPPSLLHGLERLETAVDHYMRRATTLLEITRVMPILDGTQTLASIRSQAALAQLPIIMMSSLEEASVRETCTDYNSFLRKPFRAVAVVQLVAQLLAQSRRK